MLKFKKVFNAYNWEKHQHHLVYFLTRMTIRSELKTYQK